jgi:uncharacterized protein
MKHFSSALAALTLALSGGAHGLDAAAAPRIVSVTGEAEVATVPDRATLVLSVQKLDPDLKKAEGEVNKIVRTYRAEARSLGAKDEQISTTGASINPEYVWPEGGREPRFTGYRVSRQIEVRIDTLDKLGDYILRATAAGVNQVNPPMLDTSRRKELGREALAKARRMRARRQSCWPTRSACGSARRGASSNRVSACPSRWSTRRCRCARPRMATPRWAYR